MGPSPSGGCDPPEIIERDQGLAVASKVHVHRLSIFAVLAGCTVGADGSFIAPPPDETLLLFNVPHGDEQVAAHCDGADGPPDDRVSRAFCATPRPNLHSLADLQQLLHLDVVDGVNPSFALLANSSSVVATSVSSINPRAVVFKTIRDPMTDSDGFLILTFSRGEPFVELASYDIDPMTQTGSLAFYLVVIDVACRTTNTCSWADLLTPEVERSWGRATLYENNELTNTVFDCQQCHKSPGGPDAPTFLRMQEHEAPFTHWMSSSTTGGQVLLADFHAAHGTSENYGPIPASLIDRSNPSALAGLIDTFMFTQPSPFPSAKIEAEVQQSNPAQPAINIPVGASVTWSALHAAAASGTAIPPPYHDVKITDPTLLAQMSAVYRDVANGTVARTELPDTRDVVLASAKIDLTFRLAEGGTGSQVLVQACQQCHDPEADPQVSRAHFDVTKLSVMATGEKQLAIDRMHLSPDDPKIMPPRRFRSLSTAQIAAASVELTRP